MITYKKINRIQSYILSDGLRVGLLEKPFLRGYEGEIYYTPFYIPANRKQIVNGFLEKVDSMVKARQKREIIKQHKLRNSIYNTGREFKVIG